MKGYKLDIVGQKFNRWTIIEELPIKRQRSILYRAKCDCGNEKIISGSQAKNGYSKSCGCLRKEEVFKSNSLPEGEAALKKLLTSYKGGARKRGYSWELNDEAAINLFNKNCYYCNTEPSQIFPSIGDRHKFNGTIIYNGIDRINNSDGYTKGNVVSCCETCNRMKMALSEEFFIAHIKKIFDFKIMTTA